MKALKARTDGPGKLSTAMTRGPLRRASGMSLVVSLLMLVVVLLLGISATAMALQGEKASRNDRDRQVAFQAAEAGLMDAELDIQDAPVAARSSMFAPDSNQGFTDGCGAGIGSLSLGLCNPAPDGAAPIWQTVDFLDSTKNAHTVEYGRFTGQVFQAGKGVLPARLPRYIIELLPYHPPGENAGLGTVSYVYRITAIGFGMNDRTRVVLQTFYRKEES